MHSSVSLSFCVSFCPFVRLSDRLPVVPSIRSAVHPSVCEFFYSCLSLCLPVYLSVFLYAFLAIFMSHFLPACLSVCLSVCLPRYLSVWPSTCLFVFLSFYMPSSLSVCLAVRLPVCLSVFLVRSSHLLDVWLDYFSMHFSFCYHH